MFGYKKVAFREAMSGYLFILPWMIGFAVMTGYPLIFNIYLSFTKYNLIRPPKFIGLGNYLGLFSNAIFLQSLKVTLMLAIILVPLRIVFGLSTALLLNTKLRGLSVYRLIYYLPTILAGVAITILWRWIYHADFGLLNTELRSIFGIQGPAWISSETWALPSLIIMSVWAGGASMLIFLAGLQSIPTALYEAARIDGASIFVRFFYVTLPMLTPTILFVLIMEIIYSFSFFLEPYIMTGGGPHYATYTMALNIYQSGIMFRKLGYAALMSLVLFAMTIGISIVLLRTSAKWVFYAGEREK